MMIPTADRAEILRTWQIFRQPGEVLELRIPKAGKFKTISGYFDDPKKLADAVIGLVDEPFPGIYFTVNPVRPELLARYTNRVERYAPTTTSDQDITALRWLPIDLDPVRPSGISSTDDEHEAAISKAREIRSWLISREWPEGAFVLADSGNGAHLSARIDFENAQDNVNLLRQCLQALDFVFSDEKVKVDTATYNPARIWKLPGTLTKKGDNTPERPHRMARLLQVPETPTMVTKELMQDLARLAPMPPAPVPGAGRPFDPKVYAESHGATVLRTKAWEGGEIAVLKTCPFNSDHNRGESWIGSWPDGRRAFRCPHNGCRGNDWIALKKLWGSPEKASLDQNAERLEELGREDRRRRAKQDGGGAGEEEQGAEELEATHKVLADLKDKLKADAGAAYEPEVFEALRVVYHNDPQEWARVKKILTHERIFREVVKKLKEEGEDEETPPIESPFIELDNGRLAEMVVQDGRAKFAVYDPSTGEVKYVPALEVNGSRIVPPASDEIFLKGYVTLPSMVEEYGDELSLYDEIKTFVHKYLEVSEDYESIACFYPMLTWVHDVMSVIAYLRAKGDWGVGKSRFLEVFNALCYRSIATTGAMSEAPIFRIMDRWKGTMIMDEGDLGKSRDAAAAMEKILNCGFERNKPIIRCNPNRPEEVNCFDPFGPKILATRYEFRDKALESRCFTEIMKEARRTDVPIELPPSFYEEALHLRNKLLMYRFKNRVKIKERSERGEISLDTNGLPKRIQQAARPISVVLADHPDLLAKLKAFLEVKARGLVAEASETVEGYLVRVLADMEMMDSDDKEKLVWDTGYGSLIELIKTASGNHKLTVAGVKNRGNSLGFKTEKSMIQGEQKRRITCEISVFENLKKRYIPDWTMDDLDDDVGPVKEKRAEISPDKSEPPLSSLSGGV
jgi:hypothetical protein